MNSLSSPIARTRLSRELIDRSVLLNSLLILCGFVSVYVAVQRPLLAIEGLCALSFLYVALQAPVLAVAGFFAITFLAGVLDKVAGGSFSPGVWAAKGAGGCLVLVWIFSTLARREGPVVVPAVRVFAAAALALVIWALSSALWSADPHSAVAGAARLAQGPLLMIVIVAFVQTTSALAALCYTFIGGAALSAVAGLTGVIHSATPAQEASGRLSGGVGDPNFLAAVLIPAIALALFMALAPGRGRLYRAVMLATSGLCLIGVFLTQSRGGIIALGVVVVLSIAFAGRVRTHIIGVSLVVASTAAIYLALLAPPHELSRFSDIRAGGGTGRTDLWAIAMQVFKSHPLRGVGLDNFTVVSATYAASTDTDLPRADVVVTQRAPVHNTYLEVAAELGVVGEVLLLGLFGIVLEATRRGVRLLGRRREQTLELAGRGLFVGAAGMLTAFVFLSAEYEKELWITLGLLLAFSNIARRRATAESSEPRLSAGS